MIDTQGSLTLVDISVPSSPVERGFYNTPGIVHGVYAVGDTLYIADGTNGLMILDIQNVAGPVTAGYYMLPTIAMDVFVDENNHIYVTGNNGGLFIVEYEDAGDPPTSVPTPMPTTVTLVSPSATPIPTDTPSMTPTVEAPTATATDIPGTDIPATEVPTTIPTTTTAIPTPTDVKCSPTVSIDAPATVTVGDIFNVVLSFSGPGERWWYISQFPENPNIEAIVDGSQYKALTPGTVTYWAGIDTECGESVVETVLIQVVDSGTATPVETAIPFPSETATEVATEVPTETPAPTSTPTSIPTSIPTLYLLVGPATNGGIWTKMMQTPWLRQ